MKKDNFTLNLFSTSPSETVQLSPSVTKHPTSVKNGKIKKIGFDIGQTNCAVAFLSEDNQVVRKPVYFKIGKVELKNRRTLRGQRRSRASKKRRLRDLKRQPAYKKLPKKIQNEVYKLFKKRGYDFHRYTRHEIRESEQKEMNLIMERSLSRDEVEIKLQNTVINYLSPSEAKSLETLLNRKYRPVRFDNRIQVKCPVCGKNTPLRKNVKDLLVASIVRWLDIPDESKSDLILLTRNKELKKAHELAKKVFAENKVNVEIRKQVYDIFKNAGSGRLAFCKQHFLDQTASGGLDNKKKNNPSVNIKRRFDTILKYLRSLDIDFSAVEFLKAEKNDFDISGRKKKNKKVKGKTTQTKDRRARLLEETDGHCIYCGCKLTLETTTIDHIYPRSKGGSSIYRNLVACCSKCNGDIKGKRIIDGKTVKGTNDKVIKFKKKYMKNMSLSKRKYLLSYDFSPLADHVSKTESSVGWRYFKEELKKIFPNAKYERFSGRSTAFFRRNWKLRKKGENGKQEPIDHVIDAVVIGALDLKYINKKDGYLKKGTAPVFDEDFDTVKAKTGLYTKDSRKIDTMPYSIKNGKPAIKKSVVEKKDVEKIVDTGWKRKVSKYFEENPEVKKLDFSETDFGCKSIRVFCGGGFGLGNAVKLGNNVFKTTATNDATLLLHKGGSGKGENVFKQAKDGTFTLTKSRNEKWVSKRIKYLEDKFVKKTDIKKLFKEGYRLKSVYRVPFVACCSETYEVLKLGTDKSPTFVLP